MVRVKLSMLKSLRLLSNCDLEELRNKYRIKLYNVMQDKQIAFEFICLWEMGFIE